MNFILFFKKNPFLIILIILKFGIICWECVTRSDPYGSLPPFQVIFAGNKEFEKKKNVFSSFYIKTLFHFFQWARKARDQRCRKTVHQRCRRWLKRAGLKSQLKGHRFRW